MCAAIVQSQIHLKAFCVVTQEGFNDYHPLEVNKRMV